MSCCSASVGVSNEKSVGGVEISWGTITAEGWCMGDNSVSCSYFFNLRAIVYQIGRVT